MYTTKYMNQWDILEISEIIPNTYEILIMW